MRKKKILIKWHPWENAEEETILGWAHSLEESYILLRGYDVADMLEHGLFEIHEYVDHILSPHPFIAGGNKISINHILLQVFSEEF